MIPQVKQHIKCILRNGAVVEGIVENWSDSSVQLKSLDDESILIITHPSDDIVLIKIILKSTLEEEKEIIQEQEPLTNLEQQIEDAKQLPADDPMRLKTLAELRIMLNKQEKKILTEKVREHHIGEVRKAQYGYPSVIKK